ncbi:hypothetical protein FYJ24_01425 [Actinomycetaceae bacterium WB03_NA08]|uniref:Histone acetyltransferase Rv0428c-like SH3 domain-containing protein n=1 Tax=Scrofimicrobium canadense TaxID=2652290 RepID=A0A6N7W2D3_9ACTO|nr:hypothetical protein [Scrofimicrobium canadense]
MQVTIHSLPWLDWTPGDRVVVRYRASDGVHDALGELLETAPEHVRIRARRGDVLVKAETMITGKLVSKRSQIAE